MNKQRWLTLVVLAVLLVATSPKPALSSFTPLREPEVRLVTDRHRGLGDVVSDEWLAHMRADLATATPDWEDEGEKDDSRYGEAIASAGDFNGDGYDDLIVGAWYYSITSAPHSGRAYLYYGSASGLSDDPGLVFDPPLINTDGFFGTSVGTAGDVNGDGVDDIIIGMDNWDGTYTDEGAAFVYYGSDSTEGPDNKHDWFAHGNMTHAHFGSSVSTAGDVNDDGYDDIMVGAYWYDSNWGAVFVWHGSPDPTGLGATGTPANADWDVQDIKYDSGLASVSTAGDVNGDGSDDIIVGAGAYDNPNDREGLVMVWYGSSPDGLNLGVDGTLANADWKIEGNADNRELGESIGTLGDVNDDGYDDIILGSYHVWGEAVDGGDALVFYGSIDGLTPTNATPADADWKIEDPVGGDARTFSVQRNPGADVNGDGYDDAIIGITGYDVISGTLTLSNAGAVAVWYGSAAGLGGDETVASADWLAEGGQAGEYMGRYVNTAGDVDNNGAADVAAGAPYYDLDPITPGNNYGRAYAYYFNPSPTITSLSPASATAGGPDFTLTVNGTGFFNGESTVRWNGSDRATTYGSNTQLTASISAADIATAGTAGVTVLNSAPGGGISNPETFTINNPLPTITSLSPASATVGGPAFTLTVNGTDFVDGASTVRWNGSDRATTYVSSTQLTASISAADIATVGTASVTVFNSAPGGGTSNAMTFTIDYLHVYLPVVLKNFP